MAPERIILDSVKLNGDRACLLIEAFTPVFLYGDPLELVRHYYHRFKEHVERFQDEHLTEHFDSLLDHAGRIRYLVPHFQQLEETISQIESGKSFDRIATLSSLVICASEVEGMSYTSMYRYPDKNCPK